METAQQSEKTPDDSARSYVVKRRLLVVQFLCFALLVALHATSPQRTRHHAPLSHDSNIRSLVARFEEKELAHIFLTNTGRLPPDLRRDLGETGVLHFLAISAGQLQPVIFVIERAFTWAVLIGGPLGFAALMRNRALLALGVAASLSHLYGLTGSLMRLLFVDFGYRCFAAAILSTQTRREHREPLSKRWRPSERILQALTCAARQPHLFLILCLVAENFRGRNLLGDWSFLFASLGAQACVTGSQIAAKFVPAWQRTIGRPSLILRGLWTLLIIQTFATLVMLPLTPVSLGPALLMNLVAGPLIGILVVPATVALTLWRPEASALSGSIFHPLAEGLIALADTGLRGFRIMAQFFADLDDQGRTPMLAPFSESAYGYAVSILGIAWFVPLLWDCLQSRPKSVRNWGSVRMATPSS